MNLATRYLLNKGKGLQNKGNVVGAVLLDLKKAFDTFKSEILLSKQLNKIFHSWNNMVQFLLEK